MIKWADRLRAMLYIAIDARKIRDAEDSDPGAKSLVSNDLAELATEDFVADAVQHLDGVPYVQIYESSETYAAGFKCIKCKGTWSGHVTGDPSQPTDQRLVCKFCPVCGTSLSREVRPTEATERHQELRGNAAWKNREITEALAITYTLETWADFRDHWEWDSAYRRTTDYRIAFGNWKERLKSGSWFGEKVRLVARTKRWERVIYGPIDIPGDSLNKILELFEGDE